MPLPRMSCARPPIVEVVCGVMFEPVTELDAVDWGEYWLRRRGDYPSKELHHAVLEPGTAPMFTFGSALPPARVRLKTADLRYLLQLQHDRIYVNWKSSPDSYPRFWGDANQQGLRDRAMLEYQQYATFVQERTATEIRPVSIELQKVNVVARGESEGQWRDLEALKRMLVLIEGLPLIDDALASSFEIVHNQQNERGTLMTRGVSQGAPKPVGFRLDIQGRRPVEEGDMTAAFDSLNVDVNAAFASCLSESAKVSFGLQMEQLNA